MAKDNFELLKKAHDKKMPAITFIAQDKCSRPALTAYRDSIRQAGADPGFIKQIDEIIEEWDNYQDTNPTKVPD